MQPGERCLICGDVIHSVAAEASVDDGRKPGTPNRWRTIGYTHEGNCESAFRRSQGDLSVPPLPGPLETIRLLEANPTGEG